MIIPEVDLNVAIGMFFENFGDMYQITVLALLKNCTKCDVALVS
jgi:hypothetical protein